MGGKIVDQKTLEKIYQIERLKVGESIHIEALKEELDYYRKLKNVRLFRDRGKTFTTTSYVGVPVKGDASKIIHLIRFNRKT